MRQQTVLKRQLLGHKGLPFTENLGTERKTEGKSVDYMKLHGHCVDEFQDVGQKITDDPDIWQNINQIKF